MQLHVMTMANFKFLIRISFFLCFSLASLKTMAWVEEATLRLIHAQATRLWLSFVTLCMQVAQVAVLNNMPRMMCCLAECAYQNTGR